MIVGGSAWWSSGSSSSPASRSRSASGTAASRCSSPRPSRVAATMSSSSASRISPDGSPSGPPPSPGRRPPTAGRRRSDRALTRGARSGPTLPRCAEQDEPPAADRDRGHDLRADGGRREGWGREMGHAAIDCEGARDGPRTRGARQMANYSSGRTPGTVRRPDFERLPRGMPPDAAGRGCCAWCAAQNMRRRPGTRFSTSALTASEAPSVTTIRSVAFTPAGALTSTRT